MAKFTRYVGKIFFALVISFLVIMGSVLIANNTQIEDRVNLSNQNDEVMTTSEVPDVTAANTLDWQGDDETMKRLLSQASQMSAYQRLIVKLELGQDWTVKESITFMYGTTIIIDLKGHTLTAASTLTSSLFSVKGMLYIMDSEYDKNKESIKSQVKSIYANASGKTETQILNELKQVPCGKITGANTTGHGGAFNVSYSDGSNGSTISRGFLKICGGMIYNNRARDGAAIFAGNKTRFNVVDGIFAANKVTDNGGAIYTETDDSISNALFAGNSASWGAGIGISDKSSCNVVNCELIYNKASTEGAGICTRGVNTFENITVSNNISETMDGGICIRGNANIKINNSTIQNNQADYGAGIYCGEDSYVKIKDTNVSGNIAKRHCGGIYVTAQSITYVDNCTIEDNKALGERGTTFGGTGIQALFNSTLYVSNVKVRNNYGLAHGGGIGADDNAKFYLQGSNDITGNTVSAGVSDIYLASNKRIYVNGELSLGESGKGMCLEMNEDNEIFRPFTLGYTIYGNENNDPKTLFYNKNSKYVAKLKNDEVMFDYQIDQGKIYDFIYLEDGCRKNYSDNDKFHGYNDANLNIVNGQPVYVIGNINPNTSIIDFVSHLASLGIDKNNMGLFNNKDTILYDSGSAMNIDQALLDDGINMPICTGWYIKHNNAITNKVETVYLSVLGDVNGDGRISASDVSYLRQIASDKALYESLDIEKKLACAVVNKGNVTTADAEIVRNVIDKLLTINLFF